MHVLVRIRTADYASYSAYLRPLKLPVAPTGVPGTSSGPLLLGPLGRLRFQEPSTTWYSVGFYSTLVQWTQQQVTPAEKTTAEQIRARVTVHDRDGIIRAVTWMQPLLDKWTERLRGYHKIGETAAMPGAKLVALVTRHMRTVFAEHAL